MAQQYTINKFYGGLSGDDYIGSEGSCVYSENVDYRQNYNGLELVRALQVNGSTSTYSMYGFTEVFTSATQARVFSWGEDGKFYGVDGTALGAITTGNDVLNAQTFGDYVYFITDEGANVQLHRITKSNAYTYAATTNGFNSRIVEDAITGILGDAKSNKYPMYNYVDEAMYFGVGPKLYKLAIGDSTASEVFSNDLEADIVGITEYSGLFKIYLQNGKICFWDGQGTAFSAITTINNTINNVYNYGDSDYILAGFNSAYSELHILQGYQAQLLQRVIYSEREQKYPFAFGSDSADAQSPQIMAKRLGLLWLGANSGSSTGFYTFGSDVLGVNNGFQLNYTADDSEEQILETNAIFPYTSGAYMSYRTAAGNKIGKVNLNVNPSGIGKQTAGEWVSRIFDAGTRTQQKQVQKIKVKCSNTTSGNYITIKARRDGGIEETVGTCNTNDDQYEFVSPIGEFSDIQLRAEFVGDGINTPKLEEITLIYDIIND